MVRVQRLACLAVLHKATWDFVQLTSSVAWAGLHWLSMCLGSAIVFPSCPTLPITVCILYPNGCPYVCWEIAPASPSTSAPPREIPNLYPACIKSWCNATGPYSAGSERIKTCEWFWYALKNRILLINAFALTHCTCPRALCHTLTKFTKFCARLYERQYLTCDQVENNDFFEQKNKIQFSLLFCLLPLSLVVILTITGALRGHYLIKDTS